MAGLSSKVARVNDLLHGAIKIFNDVMYREATKSSVSQ